MSGLESIHISGISRSITRFQICNERNYHVLINAVNSIGVRKTIRKKKEYDDKGRPYFHVRDLKKGGGGEEESKTQNRNS